MSYDTNRRPSRSSSGQDLWPKWMWVAIPVLVVFVVAGLWWAIFSPDQSAKPTPTPSPTPRIVREQPTQMPTVEKAASTPDGTPTTVSVLPTLPGATSTPVPVMTLVPQITPTASGSTVLTIGSTVKVTGTGGSGLLLRAGAGKGHAQIKLLPEGTALEVVGGPKDADNYTWWQVRDAGGTTGWGAGDFLRP